MKARKELLKGLSEDQIAKVRDCANVNDLLVLAKDEGVELNEEQLEAVNGGGLCRSTPDFVCPVCGSKNVSTRYNENSIAEWYTNTCKDCGKTWIVNV